MSNPLQQLSQKTISTKYNNPMYRASGGIANSHLIKPQLINPNLLPSNSNVNLQNAVSGTVGNTQYQNATVSMNLGAGRRMTPTLENNQEMAAIPNFSGKKTDTIQLLDQDRECNSFQSRSQCDGNSNCAWCNISSSCISKDLYNYGSNSITCKQSHEPGLHINGPVKFTLSQPLQLQLPKQRQFKPPKNLQPSINLEVLYPDGDLVNLEEMEEAEDESSEDNVLVYEDILDDNAYDFLYYTPNPQRVFIPDGSRDTHIDQKITTRVYETNRVISNDVDEYTYNSLDNLTGVSGSTLGFDAF